MDAVVATLLVVHQGGTAMTNPLFHRASLRARFAAHLIDRLLFYAFVFLVLPLAGQAAPAGAPTIGALIALPLILGYMIVNSYFAARGTTPGKRVIGLKLITSQGQRAGFFTVIARETIGKLISAIFGIGFIWAFVNDDDRALHDILFGTHVVEAAKYNADAEKPNDE